MAPRRVFTIKEKAEIISKLKNGVNNADLCKEYKVSHSTISAMWKNRDRILECFGTKSLKVKKDRKPMHQDVENALLEWLKTQSQNLALSGRLLQEKANHFAMLLGKTEFKCSESWIYRFRKRYDIVVGKCGVASSVLRNDCDNWRKTALTEDYADSQIRNADQKDPEPNDDRNTSASSTRDDQTTSQAVTVKYCSFCRRVQAVLRITDKPYVKLNKTTLTINDLRIEVDFNEDTTKTVCANCDIKLIEILEFVKVATEAQDILANAEVNDLSNLNPQNEECGMRTGSDFGNRNYNKTNDQRDVEWLYESDTESVIQTVVAYKRKADLNNHDGKKKRRDLVLDPLSLNNDNFDDIETNEMLKCKDIIHDKQYVKEVITANGIVNVSEYDERTEIKVEMIETMNDEGQQIQPKNRGIEIVVSKEPQANVTNKNIIEETTIKEEIIETRFEMEPTEGLSSICPEKINELVRKRKVANETVSSSSEVTESSDSDLVGTMNRSDLVILVKTIGSEMLSK